MNILFINNLFIVFMVSRYRECRTLSVVGYFPLSHYKYFRKLAGNIVTLKPFSIKL